MGKQKYPNTSGGVTIDGERKQRDHTKKGIKARRHNQRRLEAVERQESRIKMLEEKLAKAKDKKKATENLTHAQLTLQQIRGGVSHAVLAKRFAEPQVK